VGCLLRPVPHLTGALSEKRTCRSPGTAFRAWRPSSGPGREEDPEEPKRGAHGHLGRVQPQGLTATWGECGSADTASRERRVTSRPSPSGGHSRTCGLLPEDQEYFCLLLAIFLVELVAGVLAHVYYQRLSDELKQHLTRTLAENYRQPGAAEITASVDRLQQDFKCCGSNSSADWLQSSYILSPEAEGRRVPDSCCKTVVARCGQRAHPSNIYKVEGGCISKLEQFLADHLLLMGAVGIGVACLQICGMILTCGLHRRLQLHFY
uniref:Tetraspanin 11 n=1 Tax=Bos taurus TaxID=9913 RepID=A0AAA9SJJ7_BOVIN